jgi:hypothetical protein
VAMGKKATGLERGNYDWKNGPCGKNQRRLENESAHGDRCLLGSMVSVVRLSAPLIIFGKMWLKGSAGSVHPIITPFPHLSIHLCCLDPFPSWPILSQIYE